MKISKQTRNEHGEYVFERLDDTAQFVCERCLKAKVSKIVVKWRTPEGEEKKICNGCYGFLMSSRSR